MKIAISATSSSLDAPMDQRFGRCPCFVITDSDGADHEAVDNPHAQLGHGAGIQAARMLIERGVTTVLTGRCGPNASDTLEAGNIEIVTGLGGTVRQAVEKFAADRGKTHPPGDPVSTQNGSAPPQGRGAGRGMGRGGGRGRGRGMGPMNKPGN